MYFLPFRIDLYTHYNKKMEEKAMRKKTVPTFLFWTGLAWLIELITSLIWFHRAPGLFSLLLWAAIQALPYLLHIFCVKNSIWEGSKLIVSAMAVLFILVFFKNWIFGVVRFGNLLSQLIVRIGYQVVLLYNTKKFG